MTNPGVSWVVQHVSWLVVYRCGAGGGGRRRGEDEVETCCVDGPGVVKGGRDVVDHPRYCSSSVADYPRYCSGQFTTSSFVQFDLFLWRFVSLGAQVLLDVL